MAQPLLLQQDTSLSSSRSASSSFGTMCSTASPSSRVALRERRQRRATTGKAGHERLPRRDGCSSIHPMKILVEEKKLSCRSSYAMAQEGLKVSSTTSNKSILKNHHHHSIPTTRAACADDKNNNNKKAVRFHPRMRVRLNRHIGKYTESEISSCWYSPSEDKDAQRDALKEVHIWRKQQHMEPEQGREEEDAAEASVRGLEHLLTPCARELRRRRRSDVVRSVLEHQWFVSSAIEPEEGSIVARASMEISRKAVKEARERGRCDAHEVRQEEMRKETEKETEDVQQQRDEAEEDEFLVDLLSLATLASSAPSFCDEEDDYSTKATTTGHQLCNSIRSRKRFSG